MYRSRASAYSVSPGPLARKKVILEDREKANVPCELAAAASARSARVKMAPPWVLHTVSLMKISFGG